MEHHLEPGVTPLHYERYSQDQNLIKRSFHFYFPSKILHDCYAYCTDHIEALLKDHNQDVWWRYLQAGDISKYKGSDNVALQFYNKALNKLTAHEQYDPTNELVIQYKLGDYSRCIQLGESLMDSMLVKKQYSALRYFIISKMNSGEQIKNEQMLLKKIYDYDRFPGHGAYYLASIECKKGNYPKALTLLKRALNNGVGFNTYRYNFDPDFRSMYDMEAFKTFCAPK